MPRGIPKARIDTETMDGSKVELIADQSIETPATTEFGREMSEEAFMNELVTVYLHDTTDENAAPHFICNVNGSNQPFFRGATQIVKRKFVEVLARCKESRYTQRTANPFEPDRIEMVQRTALAYPFDMSEDKNPKGRAWLKAVLAEAN